MAQFTFWGGQLAVSDDVETAVKAFGNVIRLSGANRYDTNLEVLSHMNLNKGTDLIICSGKTFQDALSASATGIPIMLTDGSLSAKQLVYLSEVIDSNSNVYIVGGPVAVPESVDAQVRTFTSRVSRVYGKDSYETSIAIAKKFHPDSNKALLATTKSFRDGLSGSVLSYVKSAPLLLTNRSEKFEASFNYIAEKNINTITILGGPAAVDIDATGLTDSGTRKTGFLSIGNKKYYADSNNKILKSEIVTVNGKQYYLNAKGVMVTSTTFTKGGDTWIAAKDGTLSKPSKVIYLTFDDGPGPYTSRLIDILDKYGAKATFFVNGNKTSYNYCIGKAYRNGHAIGNHTYSHDYSYVYRSTANFWADVEKTNNIIKAQTGTTTKLLRFPGGSSNMVSRSYSSGIMTTLVRQCKEKGWTYFDWNVDSNDAGGTLTSSGVYKNIVSGVSGKKSAVVLCHDIKSYTVNAIEDVIKWGQANGYVFLALNSSSPTAHHGVNN